MTRPGSAIALIVLAATLTAAPARAQSPTPQSSVKSPATGKNLEIAIGAMFLTPVSMGEQDISLIAPGGGPFDIANTTSRTAPSVGLEARLGFRGTSRLRLEVAAGWSHVDFQTSVSGDIENAPDVTASLAVSRFTAGGDVTFQLVQKPTREFYAIGGVSWMRELSELSASGVYDDGAIVDTGAGVKMWWRDRPKSAIKRMGLRLEGRLGIRVRGLSLDGKDVHIAPAFLASVIFGS